MKNWEEWSTTVFNNISDQIMSTIDNEGGIQPHLSLIEYNKRCDKEFSFVSGAESLPVPISINNKDAFINFIDHVATTSKKVKCLPNAVIYTLYSKSISREETEKFGPEIALAKGKLGVLIYGVFPKNNVKIRLLEVENVEAMVGKDKVNLPWVSAIKDITALKDTNNEDPILQGLKRIITHVC